MVFREKKTVIFILAVLVVFLVSSLTRVSSQTRKGDIYVLPTSFGAWQSRELDYNRELLTGWLGTDHIIFRRYQNTESRDEVVLYIAYYKDLESSDLAHAPEVCYPGQGWRILSNQKTQLNLTAGTHTNAKRIIIEKDSEQEIVYYWWQTEGNTFAGNSFYHLLQIMDRITFKDTSSVWVRISARNDWINEQDVVPDKVIREFCEEAVPLIDQYFKQGKL